MIDLRAIALGGYLASSTLAVSSDGYLGLAGPGPGPGPGVIAVGWAPAPLPRARRVRAEDDDEAIALLAAAWVVVGGRTLYVSPIAEPSDQLQSERQTPGSRHHA